MRALCKGTNVRRAELDELEVYSAFDVLTWDLR